MVSNALVGFLGVILGSVTTSVLTVYRERTVTRREREANEELRTRQRSDERGAFQRESMLSLQDTLSALVQAVYDEQDRMLQEWERTGSWQTRTWLTPTATGWQSVELRVETMAARVFDDDLRSISAAICTASRDAVWASSAEDSEHAGGEMKALNRRFNLRLSSVLPDLYR